MDNPNIGMSVDIHTVEHDDRLLIDLGFYTGQVVEIWNPPFNELPDGWVGYSRGFWAYPKGEGSPVEAARMFRRSQTISESMRAQNETAISRSEDSMTDQ